jgi:hypothetical protein
MIIMGKFKMKEKVSFKNPPTLHIQILHVSLLMMTVTAHTVQPWYVMGTYVASLTS